MKELIDTIENETGVKVLKYELQLIFEGSKKPGRHRVLVKDDLERLGEWLTIDMTELCLKSMIREYENTDEQPRASKTE